MQPLNPAAHNVLGLACEARRDHAAAVASYRLALRLLPLTRDPDALVHHPGTASSSVGAAVALQTAVQLNLARALVLAGGVQEAVQQYEELEVAAGAWRRGPVR